MSIIEDLMAPGGMTVFSTQSARDAADRIEAAGHAVVLNLSYRPLGILTVEDLIAWRRRDPEGWEKRRCACLVITDRPTLRPEHPIAEVFWLWRNEGRPCPLMVLDGESLLGVLHPEKVGRWSAEHAPELFEEFREFISGWKSADVTDRDDRVFSAADPRGTRTGDQVF